MLDGAALRLLRIRHAFAHMPERLRLSDRGGNYRVIHQPFLKTLFKQPLHHGFRRCGRVIGGDIDQHIPRVRGGQRVAHAGNMPRGEINADARHQFEPGQRCAAEIGCLFEKLQCALWRGKTGKGHLMSCRSRKQFQHRTGDDTKCSFRADKQITQIIARVIFF